MFKPEPSYEYKKSVRERKEAFKHFLYMLDRYEIRWKLTWREKKKCINQTTSEWKITWFEKLEDRSNFPFFPLPFSQPQGGTRRSPCRRGQRAPGGGWHLSQQHIGFSASSCWCCWGCLAPLSSTLGSPSSLLKWTWPLSTEEFSFLKHHWNHFSNHSTAWFWAGANPATAGIKPHTARKLWGWTALAEEWKTPFSKR